MQEDESDIEDYSNFQLHSDLRKWAVEYNIRHAALNSLLEILNKKIEDVLPKDVCHHTNLVLITIL